MKQSVNLEIFMQAFHSYNRYNQFGYEALKLLFDYFEDIDENMELDVIAICCDYSHDSLEEIAHMYSIDLNDANPEDNDYKEQCSIIIREWLSECTTIVGETSTGFVYYSSF